MFDVNIQNLISQGRSFIVGGNNDEFIGLLNLNKYDVNSISNPYGSYGSKYSTKSIWNKYGTYGSPYAYYSAFNPYTMAAPKIYLHGVLYGHLSKNHYIGTHVDPDRIKEWMEVNHLNY